MHSDAHAHAGAPDEVHHQPLPVTKYVGVLVALLVFTAITVGVSRVDLGKWNMAVALAVAITKASLVVLYFMNLRHDHDHLNRVVFIVALLFLGIYLTGTFSDLFSRGAVDPWRGEAAELPQAFQGGAAVTPNPSAEPAVPSVKPPEPSK